MASSILRQAFSSPLLRGKYEKEESLIPFNYEGSEQEQKRLISIVNKIASHSETAKEVMMKAAEGGYTLSFGMQKGSYGFANADGKQLVLNPCVKDDNLLNTLVHESRHAGQFINGMTVQFGQMDVKSEVMTFRAMEADASAVAALAMMEAQKNGMPMKKGLFTMDACTEAQNLFNNGADKKDILKAEFDSWYKNRLIREAYEDGYIVKPMKEAMKKKEEKDMPYSASVTSAEIIDKICATKDGGCYFDDKNVLSDKKYMEVTYNTKCAADRFFEVREMRTGMKPDTSYRDLPLAQSVTAVQGVYHGIYYTGGVYFDKKPKESKLPSILAQKQKSR